MATILYRITNNGRTTAGRIGSARANLGTPLRNDPVVLRLTQLHDKAMPVSLKTDTIVKPVSGFPLEIARECELVTAPLPAAIHSEAHHPHANALALPVSLHYDVFYNAGWCSHVGQVIHDQQRKCPDNGPTQRCDIDLVVWIAANPREDRLSLFNREDSAIIFDFNVQGKD
jgi:hypothetical protein